MSITTQRWLSTLAVAGFLVGMGLSAAWGDSHCPPNTDWYATATVSKVTACINEPITFSATHTCLCPIADETYSWSSGHAEATFTTSFGSPDEGSDTVTVTISNYFDDYTVSYTVVDVTGSGGSASLGNDGGATAYSQPNDGPVTWQLIAEYPDDPKVPLSYTPTESANEYKVTVTNDSGDGYIMVRASHPDLSTCYEDLKVSIKGCVCACAPAEDGDEADPYSWIALGRTKNGVLSGRLRIAAEEMSPALATPHGLTLDEFGGVDDVVRAPLDGTNVLRQVLAPECLADIVVSNEFKYGVHFYRRADVAAQDTNGLYTVAGGAEPFVSFIFENPAASTNDVHLWRKTKIIQGLATVTEFEYALVAGVPQWTLRQGNGLRAERVSTVTNASGEVITLQVEDAAQQIVMKRRVTFQNFDWGMEVVSSVDDPDGAALATTRSYYDDANPGQYGKLCQIVNADGSWKRYDYDSEGRKTEEISSWLNAGTNASANEARAVYYTYESVYPYYLTTNIVVTNGVTNEVVVTNAVDEGIVNSSLPRITTEKIQGNIVSKTYNVYYETAAGERVEIEERTDNASASHGDASNLRTVKVYYPLNVAGTSESGKLKTVTYPDGRLDSFSYEEGEYAGGVFTPNPTGTYVRATTIHSIAANPVGIANKTTSDVTVSDKFGQTLLQEQYVYTGSGDERIAWTTYTYDDLGHLLRVDKSNGTYSEATWACCGKESEKDENGIERLYAYDALQRLVFSKKVGVGAGEYPVQPDQITTYTYDAEGRRLTEVLSAGSLSHGRTNQYDLAGRRTESTDFAGRKTGTSYSPDGLITTEALPGGFTRVTERFKDGQVKTITGTAQIPRFHEYGVNADGTRWTKVYSASNNSPVWVKTTTDLLGRAAKVEKPGYSTTEVTENFYNNKNQLVKQSTVHGSQFTVTLFAYDELGNQIRSGLDVNGNGTLDLDGIDRITEADNSYEMVNGAWSIVSVNKLYATDNSAATITTSITRQRLTGLGTQSAFGILQAEIISIDPFNHPTINHSYVDRDAKKVTQTVDVPNSTGNDISISVNGLLVSAQRSTLSAPTLFTYDALGRQTGTTDPRTGTATTHYDSHGWLDYTEDAGGNRTTFTYDPATGRRLSQFNALTGSTYWAYTTHGKEERIWGSADYPVRYEYDAYDRMVKQHTFRNGSGWEGSTWPANPGAADTTEWIYHEASGLLLAKKDAAGKQVSYAYSGNSKLETRNWARTDGTNSLVTTYTYNSANDLIGIDYSDLTPDVSFTYDRLGRQKTAASSVSAHSFAYSGLLLASETIVSAAGTNVIDRSYDSLGRTVATALRAVSSPDPEYSVSYAYDSVGRLNQVSHDQFQASYSYLPNSDLLSGYTIPISNFQFQVSKAYELNRNLLTQIKNSIDSTTISQYDYANDAGGRRISVKNSGTGFQPVGNAFNLYGYNTRSEVISAERFFGSDPQAPGAPVAGQNWDYAYDPIGNRTSAARDGDTEVYTANNLNQYTERTLSGTVPLSGTASEDATVTINRPSISGITVEPVTRQGAYFHKKLVLDNSTRADVEEIAVVGVKALAGTGGVDIVSSYSGVVWAVQSPELFTYDADGNMLADALRRYEWDAENRLIAVTSSNVVDGSLTWIEFSYDYMSRRSSKTVYNWISNNWSEIENRKFIYDGWNLIKEVCAATGKGTITDYYIWGLDLSGSLQGAGGIGGLLARYRSEQRYYDEQGMLLICHRPPGNPENEQTIRINKSAWPAHASHGDSLGACAGGSVSNSAFLYTFDGNGNVSELLSPQSAIENRQFIVAHYEYSPFGELIVSTGPEAQDNPFRFSTKYWDNEISLSYYGYRYYSPSLGRWLSRDPIGEDGGFNLSATCQNDLLNYYDILGAVYWGGRNIEGRDADVCTGPYGEMGEDVYDDFNLECNNKVGNGNVELGVSVYWYAKNVGIYVSSVKNAEITHYDMWHALYSQLEGLVDQHDGTVYDTHCQCALKMIALYDEAKQYINTYINDTKKVEAEHTLLAIRIRVALCPGGVTPLKIIKPK